MDQIKEKFKDRLKTGVLFSELTTLGIGGPIKYFIEVNTQEELVEILKQVQDDSIRYLLIGGGSNLLVSDEGFSGLVIKNKATGIRSSTPRELRLEEVQGAGLVVEAGTELDELVEYTIKEGLGGMSTMKGIPGTVGGAVYGSAGAYGDNIRDYLVEIKCFDSKDIVSIGKDEYSTGYRDSVFKHNKNLIILEATFSGFPNEDSKSLKEESLKILEVRSEKYPPSTLCPGSFFKNVPVEEVSSESSSKIPEDKIRFNKIPAGYLLEEVGAKGDRLGNIQIASNHANTFINLGGGTAQDFHDLASKYYRLVKEKFGITLEPEVQLINLPSIG